MNEENEEYEMQAFSESNEIDAFIERYKEKAKIPPDKDINLEDSELFRNECILGEQGIVKLLLNKTNDDGSFVISNEDVDWGFSQLLMTGSGLWTSSYFPKQGRLKPDETEQGIRNRELCFRQILNEMLMDRSNRRRPVNHKKIVNEILNEPHYIWNNAKVSSFLVMTGKSKYPANARLLNVLVDELESAGFDLSNANFNPKSSYNYDAMEYVGPLYDAAKPQHNPNSNKDEIHYEMLEEYLRLHLKMEYKGKQNPSIFEGIKSFFGHEKEEAGLFYTPYTMQDFSEKMQEFPTVLAKAYENAEKDLRLKDPDFNSSKLKKITNDFEAKFTPEVYKIQKSYRSQRFLHAIGLTLVTFGIAAPFVWPWYIYQRAKEPIKATDTTVQAYAKYLERPETGMSMRDTLDQPSTNEAIQQRLAEKEPVKEVKDDSGKVLGYETHKIVQPIKDDKNPDKISVFSNPFFKQANKFKEKIKEAEKEIKQESDRRPKN
jgi:hypothetical protein